MALSVGVPLPRTVCHLTDDFIYTTGTVIAESFVLQYYFKQVKIMVSDSTSKLRRLVAVNDPHVNSVRGRFSEERACPRKFWSSPV